MRYLWLIPACVTMLLAITCLLAGARSGIGWRWTIAFWVVGLCLQAAAIATASLVDRA